MATDTHKSPLQEYLAELDLWWRAGSRPVLFWRDDDVTQVSPNLVKFLELSERYRIPIVFSAIPTGFSWDAGRLIAGSSACRIAVHGYGHVNHSPSGEGKSEFGRERSSEQVYHELREGRRLVQEKSQDRFLNMFVPPWGRFDSRFRPLLVKAGYAGISGGSTLGNFADKNLKQIDCQVITEHGRQPLTLGSILQLLVHELRVRRQGRLARTVPIGLMTHHKIYGVELTEALQELFELMHLDKFDRCEIAV